MEFSFGLRFYLKYVFLKQYSIEEPVIDPVSEHKVEKNVFIVFHSGERAKNKVLKICDAFGANRYPFTDDIGKQIQMVKENIEQSNHGAYL